MNGAAVRSAASLDVKRVVKAVATYLDRRDLHRELPELEPEDIRDALTYAAANLNDWVVVTRGADFRYI